MNEIIYDHLFPLAGVMFAALIGGFISFVNLISSKENKVSELGREWIDSLRNSISQYISMVFYISLLYENKYENKPDNLEVMKNLEEPYSKMNMAYNNVIFRINGGCPKLR